MDNSVNSFGDEILLASPTEFHSTFYSKYDSNTIESLAF